MKVLISGAGIAGLALAYCLGRKGYQPLVVEKSPSLRDAGIRFAGSAVAAPVAALARQFFTPGGTLYEDDIA